MPKCPDDARPRRSRRRRRRIDRTLRHALEDAGLPEIGERVGMAVDETITHASSEIERVARRIGTQQQRRRPRPRRAPPAGMRAAQNLDLLWGLFRLRRGPRGEEHVSLLWDLVDVETRPADREPEPVAGAGGEAAPPDPYREALRRAERRSDGLRAACIFGCLGLGFFFVSSVSPGFFWRGVFGLTGIVTLALTAGVLLSSFADRLHRRFAEEEIGQVRARHEASPAAARDPHDMRALAASIAHEIRNPITAAKSLVQQMGEDPDAPENVEYAHVALEELDRVERSVSHLLRFAKDEEAVMQPLRLADVVEDALSALAERAADSGVEVQRELRSPGEMAGDPDKLRRVVLNLVGNAIDALEEGDVEKPRVQVQLGDNLAGTEVWLLVRDNGPGIPAETRARIFAPFQTSKAGGTGLGLAITRKLVDAHDGRIDVEDARGGGAEFLVTFPKTRPSQPA